MQTIKINIKLKQFLTLYLPEERRTIVVGVNERMVDRTKL